MQFMPLVWWNEHMWHIAETHNILENVIPAETLPTWGQRENKRKEGWQTPPNFTFREQVDKLLSYKYILPFKKKEGFKGRAAGPEGSHGPQKIIYGPCNLMEFAQLNSEIAWNWWLLSPFQFLSFWTGMSRTGILCLSQHCILGTDNLFLVFWSTDGEFFPRMDHTKGLTHTWLRWIRWCHLGLLSWHYLDYILDFDLMV